MLKIITRCDDAASFRSANYAIREACLHGVARNVGVMACCEHLQHAFDILKDLHGVAFGCHFTLNSEWSFPRWSAISGRSTVPALYDPEGYLFDSTLELHERNTPLDQMLTEAKAQIDKLRATGFKLTYLDTHMGVNWLPGLNDALAALCKQEGLLYANNANIPPIDRSNDSLPKNDHPARLLHKLATLTEGTFLVVGHPCYDEQEIRAVRRQGNTPGWLGPEREGERLLFTHPSVIKYFQEKNIQALRYDEALS